MWVIRAVLILILLLLMVGFAFYNSGPDKKVAVTLEPLFDNYADVPLVVVVFCSLVAGAVLSMLLFITIYFRRSMEVHSHRRRTKALEAEAAILRNRPIEESANLLKGADRKPGGIKSPFAEN